MHSYIFYKDEIKMLYVTIHCVVHLNCSPLLDILKQNVENGEMNSISSFQ